MIWSSEIIWAEHFRMRINPNYFIWVSNVHNCEQEVRQLDDWNIAADIMTFLYSRENWYNHKVDIISDFEA